MNKIGADMAMMASARWERVHADLKVIWQIYAGRMFIDLSSLVVIPRTTSRPAVPITPIQPQAAVLPKAPVNVISRPAVAKILIQLSPTVLSKAPFAVISHPAVPVTPIQPQAIVLPKALVAVISCPANYKGISPRPIVRGSRKDPYVVCAHEIFCSTLSQPSSQQM